VKHDILIIIIIIITIIIVNGSLDSKD
jgi:hypothetical protein